MLSFDAYATSYGGVIGLNFLDDSDNPTDVVNYNISSSQLVDERSGTGNFTWTFNGHTTTSLPGYQKKFC